MNLRRFVVFIGGSIGAGLAATVLSMLFASTLPADARATSVRGIAPFLAVFAAWIYVYWGRFDQSTFWDHSVGLVTVMAVWWVWTFAWGVILTVRVHG